MEQQLEQRVQRLEQEIREHYHNGVLGRQVNFKDLFMPPILSGSGAPTLSAPKGTIFIRTDGSSSSTRAYINTDGGVTWTNITTAA